MDFPWITQLNKTKKKKNKKTILILFVFYPERAPQKVIIKSNVRTVIALANKKQGQSYTFKSSTTLFVPCPYFYICFQTFSHYLKDNRGTSLNLLAVYLKHLFSNCQIICPGGIIIYTFNNLVCGTTERNEVSKRKHWELNIAIKCIYFFFCIWQSTPALLLLSLLRLVWLNFACHFPGRFHRIFSLSRCRKRKRFFKRLKEFVVHFKTGKNLWLTLKNVFVCFWLFKRW